MKLIVGLGNPGKKYEENRHNIGFKIIDKVLEDNNFSGFKEKFQSHYSEGRIAGEKVALLKPQTYMNESGRAVNLAKAFYKIEPSSIFVFHDELDLAPGKLRTKFGGGHAGHNGLRSIQACLGTPDFNRIRCGIGHPGHKDRVHAYVLGDFSKAEKQEWVDNYVDTAARFIDLLLLGQEGDYMTRMAQHAPAPEPKTKEG
ncbi:MAG: aminoacyl-tRNA hydrolase [Alphaproteobacteria bacterium]|nr:aminoacyl-tRNA hydrolase [Alphaproteobacteria bacterium]HCQ71773.1 aminoacyl-tRNA hydrolase [Rhodospirillaceae bacterium]|tara:strand:- start:3577 stop:4176 length:600 start_codon:yes stop_codon:yes gene_type:complete